MKNSTIFTEKNELTKIKKMNAKMFSNFRLQPKATRLKIDQAFLHLFLECYIG